VSTAPYGEMKKAMKEMTERPHIRQTANHNTGSPALTRVNTGPKTPNRIGVD
jgi:hypothetical protein